MVLILGYIIFKQCLLTQLMSLLLIVQTLFMYLIRSVYEHQLGGENLAIFYSSESTHMLPLRFFQVFPLFTDLLQRAWFWQGRESPFIANELLH